MMKLMHGGAHLSPSAWKEPTKPVLTARTQDECFRGSGGFTWSKAAPLSVGLGLSALAISPSISESV